MSHLWVLALYVALPNKGDGPGLDDWGHDRARRARAVKTATEGPAATKSACADSPDPRRCLARHAVEDASLQPAQADFADALTRIP